MSNLIPVSRKEQYLSKIDGMTNKSPDKTYTKEEYFFSEILGEALHKPVLETRYEMYLAKIAGREIEIPYPETRLERFLAKAAGMNISVPTPITREEMYWSTYSPFYLSNSSGTSPLTYGKCKIGTLSNYRIYGNTVDGNSVGDRTENLFDGELEIGSWNINTQPCSKINSPTRIRNANSIKVAENSTYSVTMSAEENVRVLIHFLNAQCNYISETTWLNNISNFNTPYQCEYINFIFKKGNNEAMALSDISSIMLNEGSTALPYEPYGYKVPMTVEWKNLLDYDTIIYLPEPIKMVGDEAEYIEYGTQKMYRIGADDLDVTLPALPTFPGTNVLSVGTEVQPSHIFAEFDKEREYG